MVGLLTSVWFKLRNEKNPMDVHVYKNNPKTQDCHWSGNSDLNTYERLLFLCARTLGNLAQYWLDTGNTLESE